MKTLIAYSFKTGNTKKVAEAINEVVEGDIADLRDKPDISSYDNIIIGYWADKDADEFMDNISGKTCGIFATAGVSGESDHAQDIINYGKEKLESQGNKIITSFICQGKIDPKLTEMMKNNDNPHHPWDEERAKRHEQAADHPNEEDFTNAKEAFKDFIEKAE